MAGNPDQQEDTPDDQYQDEMEDEVSKKPPPFSIYQKKKSHTSLKTTWLCVS